MIHAALSDLFFNSELVHYKEAAAADEDTEKALRLDAKEFHDSYNGIINVPFDVDSLVADFLDRL